MIGAEIIEEIDGYVIAANKNSPKMTVIAGETAPVKRVMSPTLSLKVSSVLH